MSLPDLARVTGFEWDADNARKNEKHGVTRDEAEQVFDNTPLIITEDQLHSEQESRYDALGRTNASRLLQVAFTMRRSGTIIRVISARPMSRRERMLYAKEEA
jgi:hypothetical protein